MKIQLPNGQKSNLDENISFEEKLQIVEDLVEEWMPVIILNWHSNSIKFFLDSLSNYLVWHKEEDENGYKGYEDKEILSRKKMEKLIRFKKDSKQINFTDLSKEHKESLLG